MCCSHGYYDALLFCKLKDRRSVALHKTSDRLKVKSVISDSWPLLRTTVAEKTLANIQDDVTPDWLS